MENNNTIQNELKDLSPLLYSARNSHPYTVAAGYFDSLALVVTEKIKSGEEASYSFIKEMPYSVPANYFETLPAIVVRKVVKGIEKSVFDEMEEISPFLNTISKKPVYTVPGGYLENKVFNTAIASDKKAKVISLTSAKRMTRYMAAAVVILLMAVGIFLFTGNGNNQNNTETAKAASEVKRLSDDEIVNFLKTTSPGENIVSTTTNAPKDNDIRNSVSKMSDQEIQQFLSENGEQDEM